MYTIHISFIKEGTQPVVVRNVENGFTLLEVLLNNGIEINHKCGGVCFCTTCHVYINKGDEHLEEKNRREEAFLKKAADVQPNSRLSCQCLLTGSTGEIMVTIPDQSLL